MKQIFVASSALALILGAGNVLAAEHGHKAHWSYNGEEGPAHWGEMSKDFETCKVGQMQSPINIVSDDAKKGGDLKPIEFHYQSMTNPEVINNGHAIQVNYAPGSYAVMNGVKYDLLQFHFHSPSEETINGKHGDLNAHLVHKSADGKLAVIGVLLNKGDKGNDVLNTIASAFPAHEGKQIAQGTINAADLLPENKAYFNFTGSLTTPPCSEGVNWHVMATPATVTDAQLQSFTNIYHGTNRPTQPTNDRSIAISE